MPSATGLKAPQLHSDGLTRAHTEVVRYGAQGEELAANGEDSGLAWGD